MATYYIDFSTGSDAANGTSTVTPWKHCPGDSSATGNAGSATLSAGDVVIFKGGVTYVGGFVCSHSGSSGNVIKYDGNSAGSWGTGSAILDGNYVDQQSLITINATIDYLTFDNFDIQNVAGWADDNPIVINAPTNPVTTNTGGIAFDLKGAGNDHITISNCYVHRVGGWRTTTGWDGRSVSGIAIQALGASSLVISNCEFTKCGSSAIALGAKPDLSDILITDCYIHDNINWSIDVAVYQAGGNIANVTITKCNIRNLNQMGGGWTGVNNEFEPHQNYIFLRTGNESTPWSSVNITRCFIGDTTTNPAGQGGTGGIFISAGASCNIYNNIFSRNWSTSSIPINYPTTTASQVVRIYNNTFYQGVGSNLNLGGETGALRSVYVENNLFIADLGIAANGAAINRDAGNGPAVLDYNIYYSEAFDVDEKYLMFADPGYVMFSGLQGLGYEAHGSFSNPLLTDIASQNFRPTSISPALGAGHNLTAFLTDDYYGNPRPAGGAWTVGAIQNVGGEDIITNLTIDNLIVG